MSTKSDLPGNIDAVRRFNRFYTKQIGVLQERFLRSPFSLTEARIVYELAQHKRITATELSSELGLDPGYLSRILQNFAKQRLISRKRSSTDGRQSIVSLSQQGKEAFATLNDNSRVEVRTMLRALPAHNRKNLVKAMQTIEKIFGTQPEERASFILRTHKAGDMGWVVHRHGVLYSDEYGWDEEFEALVATVVANFIQNYNPKREKCWIAEIHGEIVGSVFLVRKSETVAQLRLLLVEPRARGLGVGTRLVNECIQFAKRVGYRKITLWTNNVLLAARHIYEKAGFHLVREEPHHSFGHDLVGETWELRL